jgi:hypothetical protein
VSEPQTEAGLLSLPGVDPVYLDDGPGVIHAISEAIRSAEREAVLRWLDTEAEGLLAEALHAAQVCLNWSPGYVYLDKDGHYRVAHDDHGSAEHTEAARLVSHLRGRMTP